MKAVLLCFAFVAITFGQARGHSITSHTSAPAWLGVGFGNTDRGLEIFRVDDNSPASKAGIKVGDIILEIGGEKMQDIDQVIRTIAESSPGQKLTLALSRNGTRHVIATTLTARPLQMLTPMAPMMAPSQSNGFEVMQVEAPKLGIDSEALTPQLGEYFGAKEGVLIRSVLPGTPAETAKLKAGDVITKVDGTPVTDPHEIAGMIRGMHKSATFTVMRNHKQISVTVEIN